MGKSYVDVESNSFHKQLANFSISDRSMAVCCDVMIKLMRPGDSILQESPIGKSATVFRNSYASGKGPFRNS